MRVQVGPFDPAAHVRTRDHYQALRREAALAGLGPETPARRWEALVGRLHQELRLDPVAEAVDRAFSAGRPAFTAATVVPDETLPAALATCRALDALLAELDRAAAEEADELLAAPAEVRAYARRFLAQVTAQLEAALDGPRPGP